MQARIKEVTFNVKDSTLTMEGIEGRCTFKFLVNATQKPKKRELIPDGAFKGQFTLGINELDGDGWKICMGNKQVKVRPTEFKTGRPADLVVIQRDRKPAEKAAHLIAEEAKQLEGTRELVALEIAGKKLPASSQAAKELRLQIKQDRFIFNPTHKTQPRRAFVFKLDPNASKKTLDLAPVGGHRKDKVFPAGIYVIEREALKICLDEK